MFRGRLCSGTNDASKLRKISQQAVWASDGIFEHVSGNFES
jgi:hypothetical protein